MKNIIIEKLKEIETAEQVRVLYAAGAARGALHLPTAITTYASSMRESRRRISVSCPNAM